MIVHETTANVRPSRAAGEEWVPITSSLRSDMTAADQPMVQPCFPCRDPIGGIRHDCSSSNPEARFKLWPAGELWRGRIPQAKQLDRWTEPADRHRRWSPRDIRSVLVRLPSQGELREVRIAQVAPLYESCPPQLYGGTERVVSYLTEELVRQGHQVTLFASGDSQTQAILEAPCERALRLDVHCKDPLPYHLISLYRLARSADSFDIIHFHTDYLHFALFAPHCRKTLTTLHGRLDLPDLPPIFREFARLPLASISNAQRAPMPWANWYGTVYHGLPWNLYQRDDGNGGYLAFIGRICPEKRPDWAIEIAHRVGLQLIIAAKVDQVDRAYYEARIEPLVKHPRIEFIGEIGDRDKGAFLGGALALLFPVDWPEPFGLVMIEAMASGTPVIAFGRGSVPEIIDHGVTGFVVDSIDEAAAAVPLAKALDRAVIRRRFEERFTVERMASDYLALYGTTIGRGVVDETLGSTAAAKEAADAA
jgi:glycosyltransferase involved in cell wall biosynthesis